MMILFKTLCLKDVVILECMFVVKKVGKPAISGLPTIECYQIERMNFTTASRSLLLRLKNLTVEL